MALKFIYTQRIDHLDDPGCWSGMENRGKEAEDVDVLGRDCFLFCKVCPSCKVAGSRPIFVDVQCHSVCVTDSGLTRPDYVRIGDWSAVSCDRCGKNTKWGTWHDDDLRKRVRETVFKHGSLCWNKPGRSARDLRVFMSTARKRDGVLIWRLRQDLSEESVNKAETIPYSIGCAAVFEKVLDMPMLDYVKNNQKVRTRNEAARSALASL